MVRAGFPQHLTRAGSPASDGGAMRPCLGVHDDGRDTVGARGLWREGTDLWRTLRDQRTGRNIEPAADIVRQVGVPRAFHLSGFDLELLHFYLHLCPGHGRTVLVHHEHLEPRWRAHGPYPIFLPQTHIAVAAGIVGCGVPGDVFTTVIAHGALYA